MFTNFFNRKHKLHYSLSHYMRVLQRSWNECIRQMDSIVHFTFLKHSWNADIDIVFSLNSTLNINSHSTRQYNFSCCVITNTVQSVFEMALREKSFIVCWTRSWELTDVSPPIRITRLSKNCRIAVTTNYRRWDMRISTFEHSKVWGLNLKKNASFSVI